MNAGIKLENRKIKPKNSVFFDDVTDILRDEGYSKFWLRFRRNMHEIFDENEALKTKVEEMQKSMQEALIHINDGDYRAAETELNKAMEG